MRWRRRIPHIPTTTMHSISVNPFGVRRTGRTERGSHLWEGPLMPLIALLFSVQEAGPRIVELCKFCRVHAAAA